MLVILQNCAQNMSLQDNRAGRSTFYGLQGLFEVVKGITVSQELHSGNYCLAGV